MDHNQSLSVLCDVGLSGSSSTRVVSSLESIKVVMSDEDELEEHEHEVSSTGKSSIGTSKLDWEIPRRLRTISLIWKYRKRVPGTTLAECNMCKKCKKCVSVAQINTSNLISYILHQHKEPFQKVSNELDEQKEAGKLKNWKRDQERLAKGLILNHITKKGIIGGAKRAKLDDAVAEFIVESGEPDGT